MAPPFFYLNFALSTRVTYLVLSPAHSIRANSQPCRKHVNTRRLIMVKVVIDNAKGLVQSAGTGVTIKNGNVNITGVDESGGLSLTNATGSTPLQLLSKRETITVANGSTTADSSASFIPADCLVVAAAVSVVTASAGGNNVNITDIGTDGDADLFNEAAGNTLDINTAGGVMMGTSNAKVGSLFTAADAMRVTYGNIGTQTTAAVLGITIWYYDLSVTTGA